MKPRLSSVVASAGLIAAGYGQYRLRLDPHDHLGTWILVAGAALAAVLFGVGERRFAEIVLPQPSRGRVARAAAFILLVLGIATLAAGSFLLSADWGRWIARGWLLMVAGVGVMSAALRLCDPPRASYEASADRSQGADSAPSPTVGAPPGGTRRWTAVEIAVLVAILGVGTFLRFYRYAEFPEPFTAHAVEEPQTGLQGYQILREGAAPWEFMVDRFAAAAAIHLTGDRSMLAVRLPFTVASALTIVPLHLFLRQLAAPPAALAGSFIFAVSSWNIIYSRCAHNIFLTNGIVVTVLAFLLYFGRTRRLARLPWIGLLSGYTLYAYAGYRGTTIFTLLFLAAMLVRDLRFFTSIADETNKLVAARRVMRSLAALALAIIVVGSTAIPLFVAARADRARPSYYFEAAQRSLANTTYYTADTSAFVQQRLDRIKAAAKIFMHQGDASETFNVPGEPMLDPVTGVLFLAGLSVVAFFPLRDFNGFLLFVFVFLMLGGAVFVQNLDVRRLQGVTPLVAGFAAVFIDRLWDRARALTFRPRLFAAVPLAVAVGAFTLAWNYDFFFRRMANDPRVLAAMKNRYTTLVHYGRLHGSGKDLVLLSEIRRFFGPSDYWWMIEGLMNGRNASDLMELLPPAGPPRGERPQTVLIQKPQEREAVAALLEQVYPGTVCREFVDRDNPHIALTACDFPENARAVGLQMALTARYWAGSGPGGTPIVSRKEPFVAFVAVPRECWDEPPPGEAQTCFVEWTGTLQLAAGVEREFVLASREETPAKAFIDDVPIPAGRLHLAAGTHRVRVEALLRRQSETGVRLEWRTPDGTAIVPFYSVSAASSPR